MKVSIRIGDVKWGLEHGWRAGLTIERDEARGDYEPGNISFVTKPENSRRKIVHYRRERMNHTVLAALSLAV